MEENKASYEQLEEENQRLKEELDAIEKSQKFQKKAAKWTLRKGAGVFLGKGLKAAIKQTFTEFNTEKKVSTDTFSNLGAHIIWRITRIGLFAIILAILPISFLAIQTIYLGKQNDKIEKQNELITAQNNRLEQQTYLQEAGRRSSLVFLSNNVLDRMDDELKDTINNKDRELSDQLIGRIIVLSKSLKPYKYLENDSLSMTVSPERGQLLVNLTKAKLGEETYVKIFEDADFSFSELSDMTFEDINFGNINLSNSIFKKVVFVKCNFGKTNFSRSVIHDLKLNDSKIKVIDFSESFIQKILFYNSVLGNLIVELSFIYSLNIKECTVHYLSFYESFFPDRLMYITESLINSAIFTINSGKLKNYFYLHLPDKYKFWERFTKEKSMKNIYFNGIYKSFFIHITVSDDFIERCNQLGEMNILIDIDFWKLHVYKQKIDLYNDDNYFFEKISYSNKTEHKYSLKYTNLKINEDSIPENIKLRIEELTSDHNINTIDNVKHLNDPLNYTMKYLNKIKRNPEYLIISPHIYEDSFFLRKQISRDKYEAFKKNQESNSKN